MIEIQIIHDKKIHEDNGFAVNVLLDGEDTSVLELSQEQMLHIGAILLNASNTFIRHSITDNKNSINKYGRN